MYTGNLIGKTRILYQGNAGGVWKAPEVHNAVSEKIWPTNGLYLIDMDSNQLSSTINQSSLIQSGDLLLVYNLGINSTSTAPTAVTPSGYTNVYNVAKTTSTGQRITFYYEIANGTEAGVSITGMSATQQFLTVYLLRWRLGSVNSVTINDVESNNTFTGTVTHTVATGSSSAPAVLFIGHRCFYSSVYYLSSGTYELPNYGIYDVRNGESAGITNYYNNPETNPNISWSATGQMSSLGNMLKILNYPGTPDISVTIKGDGTFNILATGYLQIS